MSITIDYYLSKGAEKGIKLNHILSEKWSNSRAKSALENLESYRFQEGEEVEVGGTTYRIEERNPLWSRVRREETYTGQRLFEGPDGELHPSYETEKITRGQII